MPPLLSHDTRIDATPSSSSANTSSSSSMSCHEQQPQITNNNNNSENNNKLVVPKLTLKIPKAALNHQHQTSLSHQHQNHHNKFDNIDSDEDSGDEEEDESEEESESDASDSDNNEKSINHEDSSSLSENDDKENEQEVRRPENMPSLKLKIKNLTSNPESVLENFSQLSQNTETDADLSELPMDIDEQMAVAPAVQDQPEEEIKKIIIDGIHIIPANEDFRPHEINLDEALDKIDLRKFMRICLRASIPYCLYCNHARKIVVNGKSLAIHFITHHRFHAMVDSITAEELHPEKIISKLAASADDLKDSFFNLDTYDDHDEIKREGHVTVSHDRLYECFQCRFQTAIHKELYLHNRKMHTKSLINCLMCKMSFYTYSELLCHICPG